MPDQIKYFLRTKILVAVLCFLPAFFIVISVVFFLISDLSFILNPLLVNSVNLLLASIIGLILSVFLVKTSHANFKLTIITLNTLLVFFCLVLIATETFIFYSFTYKCANGKSVQVYSESLKRVNFASGEWYQPTWKKSEKIGKTGDPKHVNIEEVTRLCNS
ncbi:MAG: hypothetical protein OHK0017_08540 [Patescibacteria group bacterium]